MEGFAFANPERVAKLIKGNVTGERMELLTETLINISSRLNGWYPGLRAQWEESDPDSPLRELVRVMVSEYAKKIVSNPDGMSSETMGPYAYSRFDSEDTAKTIFGKQDVEALERLLNAETKKNVGSITVQPALRPVAVRRPGWRNKPRRTRW